MVRRTENCYVCVRCGRAAGDAEGIYFEGDSRVACMPLALNWEVIFDEWKSKYPTRTIGSHHYIRERNIKKLIGRLVNEARCPQGDHEAIYEQGKRAERAALAKEVERLAHTDIHKSANWGMESKVRAVHLDDVLKLLTSPENHE